jgi:hypothetical protein
MVNMAGMFYSLEEAAEKLDITPEELKQKVKEGKLREFRDGPNLLFKVDEVEALISEIAGKAEEISEPEPETTPTEIPSPESAESEDIPSMDDLESEELPSLEDVEPEEIPSLEDVEPEALPSLEDVEPEETPSLEDVEPEEIPELEASEPQGPAASEEDKDLDEILLAPETGAPAMSDLTDADTALTGQGTSVLGQTDRDYEITDDTMADTVITPEKSSEVPLEDIEEDVNLDSFGSGSGLLDLSLQADDTSLGGILDEIYTADGEGQEPGEPQADSAEAMAVDDDQMLPEEGSAAPQPVQEVPAFTAAPLIERAPDKQSNMLGLMLFLPLLAVIYTIVVVIAGVKEIMPSILASIQDFIWHIVAAAIVVAGIGAGLSFMVGGKSGATSKPKKTKKKKEKKPKKEKVKKEKKPKKEKKKKKKSK